MSMTHNNDKGPRKEGRKMTTGRKEDYHGKGGRLSSEARKITKGRKEDYQSKGGSQLREARKSTEGMKEDN